MLNDEFDNMLLALQDETDRHDLSVCESFEFELAEFQNDVAIRVLGCRHPVRYSTFTGISPFS